MVKLKNIEFLRFILAEILVLFHLRDFLFRPFNFISEYKYMDYALRNGEQVVDFFFIISGFFLFYTITNISTLDFVKKKIARLFPCLSFVAVLYWLESVLGYTKFDLLNTVVSDIFLFSCSGLTTTKGSISAVWFIAVLFWVSIFYFYLLRNFNLKNIKLVICLIVWLSYTLVIQYRHGGLNGNSITIIYSFLSLGLIRGLAGVGLGVILGIILNQNMIKNNDHKPLYSITILELVLFFWIFSHITFYRNPIKDDLIYLLTFTILLTCFLFKRGFLSNLLDNNFSVALGKYSFCLFISHGLFLVLLKDIFSKDFIQDHIYMTPILFLGICSAFAIVLHHFIEIPGAKLMKKWLFSESQNQQGDKL